MSETRIRWGIRHKRTGEIWRDHYETFEEAQAFLTDWLYDGGKPIFEIVHRRETVESWLPYVN